MTATYITEKFAVSPQILPDHVSALASEGFTDIVCNRPDGEEPGQPAHTEIQAACESAGINFHYLPMSNPAEAAVHIEPLKALIGSDAKVFAFCRTGNRSSMLFNAAQG
ncbi:TIGR01244 family sulfur transferase [Salinibius halmophilus]|uniref:TIGR01244 family sulfur transferase n=1 Tax=Salinibius halmophilus TaxID=1853216 RepID=UPI000E66B429|nr:TIGR01244 family sulfur transferase [Salinibius halmophilus]